MNVKIHFKQVALKQGLVLIVTLGLLLSIALMLFSSFNAFFSYMISFLTVMCLIVVLFYVNRNVPEQITIDENNIVVHYYNKAIFRNKSKTYQKEEVSFRFKGRGLIIYAKNIKVAEIRKKALHSKDWNLLLGLATK